MNLKIIQNALHYLGWRAFFKFEIIKDVEYKRYGNNSKQTLVKDARKWYNVCVKHT